MTEFSAYDNIVIQTITIEFISKIAISYFRGFFEREIRKLRRDNKLCRRNFLILQPKKTENKLWIIFEMSSNIKHMREVINISLPSPMAKAVKSAVKTGSYSSTSEFFRHLLREWQAGKLLSELNQSRQEIASGNGKVLKSLKALR